MPIYEYQCDACSNRFEKLVMRRDAVITCPQCGGEELHKLISAHAVGHGTPDTACGTAPCAPMPACGTGGCGGCQ